jgi:hypothetical protein
VIALMRAGLKPHELNAMDPVFVAELFDYLEAEGVHQRKQAKPRNDED